MYVYFYDSLNISLGSLVGTKIYLYVCVCSWVCMYVLWEHACMDVLWKHEMYGCIGVHACAYICVHPCGCQSSRPGTFLDLSPPDSLKQTLSLNLVLPSWVWLETCEGPLPSTYPAPGSRVHTATPGILHECWGSKHKSSCLPGKHFRKWASPSQYFICESDEIVIESSLRYLNKD